MTGLSALPLEMQRVEWRRVLKTVRIFAGSAAPWFKIIVSRAFSPHPLGWPLTQELMCAYFRNVLLHGDLHQWRHALFLVSRLQVLQGVYDKVDVVRVHEHSWLVGPLWGPEKAPAQRADVVLLYFHGGAFVAGSPLQNIASFQNWLAQLQQRGIHAKVLAAGYPMAPEHPFPAALDAALSMYDWLANESGETGAIIVGGDSAGGNLTLVLLAALRERGAAAADGRQRRPRGALLVSPAVDLSHTACWLDEEWTAQHEAAYDYLPHQVLASGIVRYAPVEMLTDPQVSPIYQDSYQGLVDGEVMVVAGGAELLVRDVERFVARAQQQGVQVTYHKEPHQPHSYAVMGMPHLLPKQRVIVDYIERVARGAQQPQPSGAPPAPQPSGGD